MPTLRRPRHACWEHEMRDGPINFYSVRVVIPTYLQSTYLPACLPTYLPKYTLVDMIGRWAD